MRFKTFLEQEEPRKPFTSTVDEENLIAWLKEHAPQSTRKMLDDPNARIYRGQNGLDVPFAVGDSALFRRKAANASNHVQSFIATSKNWQEYPSRERAFIGSTSMSGSDMYTRDGGNYIVIPADNARIGICPFYDFWDSFYRGAFRGTGIADVGDLTTFLKAIDSPQYRFPEDDPIALRKMLASITPAVLATLEEETYRENKFPFFVKISRSMRNAKLDNFEEWLEMALDPKSNNFDQTVGASYDKPPGMDREVWISGKAAFINVNQREFLKKKLK